MDALEKLRSEKIDLVLLETCLPGKDGWNVLDEMKRDEELKKVPVIIFTTGLYGKKYRDYIWKYHLPVLKKPFEKEELIKIVGNSLNAASP